MSSLGLYHGYLEKGGNLTGDKKKREKTNMHIAKIHSTGKNKTTALSCGTVYYAAPEVLTSLRGGTDSCSQSFNIFLLTS